MLVSLDNLYFSLSFTLRVLIPIAVLIPVAILSYKSRQLTLGACFTAFLLGFVLIYIGGFASLYIMLFFFITAGLISKVTKRNKTVDKINKKGSKRDSIQVLANGGLSALSLVLYYFTNDTIYIACFASSIAESTADTWSSEIGVLSSRSPVSILNFKPMKKGLSGGVSLLGTLSALIASFLISVLYYSCYSSSTLLLFFIVLSSGFFASVLDSILGATVQVHYYDPKLDLVRECEIDEDGNKLDKIRGLRFFDNDMVNFTSNLASILFVLSFASLI